MAAPKTNIEFIPQEDWEKTSLGKVLNWTLNVGRWIVIGTEFIVILAFLSRFKLDRDLTDLNETVKKQQAIINASASFEKEFRFIQTRLSTIENLQTAQLKTGDLLSELANITPVDVTLSDLRISNKGVTLTASALSEAGLGTLINNLKSSKQFSKVTVYRVSYGENTVGISFTLDANIKSVVIPKS